MAYSPRNLGCQVHKARRHIPSTWIGWSLRHFQLDFPKFGVPENLDGKEPLMRALFILGTESETGMDKSGENREIIR
jgi:hypothetical protein